MALFKIFGNFASGNTTLPSTATQGYCYFDKNTGKFYIDTTNATSGRMILNANKADRLSNTSKIGDTNKPVYFTADGTPTAISYTIAKSVPSTAVFTDTWEPMTGATSSTSGTVGYINSIPPKTGYNTKFWRADGTWAEPAIDNDKVYQDETTTSNWRKLLLSYNDSGTDYASVTTSTSKVFQTQKIEAQPSSGTIRAVDFQANGSDNNASYELYNNNIKVGYWKSTQSGTTSDLGYSHLYIGNNIAQGSNGNARGAISLYGKDSARHMVYSTLSGSDDQYVYLQDYAGPQYLIHGGTSSKIGDTDQPVYIAADGRATAISYTIAKSVPSTAVFTDTWNPMTGATSSTSGTVGYINAVPPKTGYNTKFWRADGTWTEPEDTKVYQGVSESTSWRKVLLSYSTYDTEYADVTTATDQVYQSANIEAQPYNGFLKARGFYLAGEGTTPAFRIYNGDTQVGMFKSTQTGTSTTQGQCQLNIGNEIAEGTAGNAKGFIALYGSDAARHMISSALTGTTNRSVILQDYAGTQYLVHASTTAAVGSSDQPVYVAANGRITAVDSSYVKTTGDTMTGSLTLSSGNVRVNTGSFCLKMEGYTRGTTATTAVERSLAFYDDAYNRIVGRVRCQVNTSGKNRVTLESCRNNASMSTAYLYVDYDSTTSSAGCSTEFTATKVWGAVYNDYAEFRETENAIKAGRCVYEQGDGKLALTNERLMRGCELVSDTYGFAIGKNEKAKTPIAVTGRVLAYCLEGQEEAKKFIGYPVCSGPNGTVSIMTEEEEAKYPSRIIGTISEVPTYDKWKCGTEENPEYIDINNRIWIRVR